MLQRIKNSLHRRWGSPQILAHLTDEEFVQAMFQHLFHRRADKNGLDAYKNFLAQGNSRAFLIDALTRSEEYATANNLFTLEEFPPGNFASAIPSKADIDRCRNINRNPQSITGIDLRSAEQFEMLKTFKPFYDEMPHHQQTEANRSEYRYIWDNPSYSPSDAVATYGMMRSFQPKRILEVGCGNSTCIMLDTNDRFFDGKIDFTLVEPYPDYLHSVLWPGDPEKITIFPKQGQDVAVSAFQELNANDILFIDSSHVSKAGSDVNHLYFEVLPSLKPGVVVHIHDVAFPLEYPQEWLDQGRYWNEQYILRALLIDNQAFEILLFTTQMITTHENWISENMPRFLEAGGSIWLRRTA